MDAARTLLVLRHARTEDSRSGHPDHQRRLTADGERQAVAVGDRLRAGGVHLDAVLCSGALRTRQTLELLRLPDDAPPASAVDVDDRYYNAGTDTLLDAVRELGDDVRTALLVGHAPGAPGLVYELTDPDRSVPQAVAAVDGEFPAAALARLDLTGSWADLSRAGLTAVWLS